MMFVRRIKASLIVRTSNFIYFIMDCFLNDFKVYKIVATFIIFIIFIGKKRNKSFFIFKSSYVDWK